MPFIPEAQISHYPSFFLSPVLPGEHLWQQIYLGLVPKEKKIETVYARLTQKDTLFLCRRLRVKQQQQIVLHGESHKGAPEDVFWNLWFLKIKHLASLEGCPHQLSEPVLEIRTVQSSSRIAPELFGNSSTACGSLPIPLQHQLWHFKSVKEYVPSNSPRKIRGKCSTWSLHLQRRA